MREKERERTSAPESADHFWHLLRKHARCHVKPYVCNAPGCGKAFSTTKDLKRHWRTKKHMETKETKEEGYLCPVAGCKEAGHLYNRKDNFVRHVRKRHVGLNMPA